MSEVEDIFTDPDPTNTATHVLCPFNQTNGIQLCSECSVERLDKHLYHKYLKLMIWNLVD